MTTFRNDTETGLETQSNLISWNLFRVVGGVSRVQSTDFDVLLCVWVRTVRLSSPLDFQFVSDPSLVMCESIPGRVWNVWRMVGVWRVVVDILFARRLFFRTLLLQYRFPSFVIVSVTDVSVCLDTWPHWETTPKPDLKHSRTWYHWIVFEKSEEWVVYRVLTLICFFVCGCGPYGWRLDSTFRLWVIPPLTCLNRFQDECEVCWGCRVWSEGWSVYRGLLRLPC